MVLLVVACGTTAWRPAKPLVPGAYPLRADAAGVAADRWFGYPPIWVPPPINSTEIDFFDITGFTQRALIQSLDNSNICVTHGPCAADPTTTSTIAWGLEGENPMAFSCRSPRTAPVPFHIFVLLPRWSPAVATVTVTLVTRWNSLAHVIYIHESTHAAISLQNLTDLGAQAQKLPSCSAVFAFWDDPATYTKLTAEQAAYHARLRVDCRPEIGCIPAGWAGW